MSKPNILETANSLIHGDRAASYGHPLDDYECTAALWRAMLKRRYGITIPLDAEFACLMMVAMKVSRQSGNHKDDNLVDGAGYLGCIERIVNERKAREAAFLDARRADGVK